MGRAKAIVDEESLIDLLNRGMTKGELSKTFDLSPMTLSRRIAEIQQKHGLLTQYRAIQALQLTELQARCLEAITPEKIEEAPLRDLIFAFKVLKDKELTLDGKPTDIKGLVGYLIKIEKEELAATEPPPLDVTPISNNEQMPEFPSLNDLMENENEDEDALNRTS